MLIAQLSDLHICSGRGMISGVVDTSTMLERAIKHLLAFAPRPDAIVITGDLVESGSKADYLALREILQPILELKHTMPCYLLVGNHDDRKQLHTVFDDLSYLKQDADFIQYSIALGPLKLIALDTVVPRVSYGDLCANRLAWFDAELRGDQRPTIVAMHHPPFTVGIAAMDVMGLVARKEFESVVCKYSHIERIVCGHVHRAIQAKVGNCAVAVCPSVAHQVNLDLETASRVKIVLEPPGYYLHWWNGQQLVTHQVAVGDYGEALFA